MEKKGYKGSVTVFLSLTCILFLGLICTVVESARVQGAKAQTANITGMGNFSVFGEFEKPLLEDYDIFSVDGSYGSGSFRIGKMEERLQGFLKCNASPKENVFSVWCFDPWNLELTDSKIPAYALLTDDKGEPFYQQAVSYMKANAGALALDKLLDYTKDSEQIKAWEEEYEKRKEENDRQLADLEQVKQEKLEQSEAESETGTEIILPEEPKNNPLKEIAKLRKRSILSIVTGDAKISDKKLKTAGLPSRHRPKKGSLKLEKKQSGVLADALFVEYLMLHFPNYKSGEQEGALAYQAEYLLGGKNSDEQNLKYVVNRLLLLREGMNYLYCLENSEMGMQTQGLAASLTGFLGIPALTAATKHALLLAWAYGESLMDVRILLDGGKVPVFKNSASWKLTLENLGRLTELLKEGSSGSEQGLNYAAYLRILLNLTSVSNHKMRALDLIQSNLQQKKGSEKFKAENCITAIQSETEWNCRPVFFSLPQNMTFSQKASIGY